ncbi:peptide ABC transporter substrate-binding protein [Kineobactrum sediminis]|uniref:Peptide ABC transporter substrate-binding protein n=1 Tax=Kineobactrum sediminis TaxID=1905677 RepID=A0A2N5Y2D8_9GAMM|nr:peptide ABC transporter substrate-binding protein [Kineobactrum sediminis]PLW82554.1 peptide ABC transporter substrate-binding protein [Kineobactrum sediminis]
MPAFISRLFIVFVALSALAACSPGESNVAQGNRDGILHFGNGSEPQGLDPHVVTGVPESKLIDALYEGLTRKNPWTLEPEPGAAARWEFSEDRRVITFYLQPEGRWSNGDPVTADDFVWSWRRALDPAMGNQYAYMLYPVANAEAYATGQITDPEALGVRALDDLTLEVTLTEPTPYFLQLMDHYSSFAVPRATIEKYGKATDRFTQWTRVGNIVTNGPFQLKEWKLNRRIVVEKNPHYWDADTVKLNGVVFYPTENIVSEERMFRVNQLHYTADVPLDKIPGYRAQVDSPFVEAPYLGTYFYLLNTKRAPMDDVRVRLALSMAIDREALTESVLYGSNDPAWSITPPGTLGYQPPQLFSYDPGKARQLLTEAGFPNGEGWPTVELMYNTSESHRKVAVAVQQMWKDVLNITVTLSNQEWKVYLDSVSQMDFQIARRGWIGDYVDPNNFLDMYITDGGNNNTGFSDPVYDELILREAPQALTREERFAIFREAETRLMTQMPILPVYTYASKHLVHPSVHGLPPNLMDFINLKYVTLEAEPLPGNGVQ